MKPLFYKFYPWNDGKLAGKRKSTSNLRPMTVNFESFSVYFEVETVSQ